MMTTIDQFMWGFQHVFRRSVAYGFQDVLSGIGLQANSKSLVLLVGFATDSNLRHQTCIEPESGPLEIHDLGSVATRTEEIRSADPESSMFHTHPRVAEQRRRALLLRSRAAALKEAIQESGKFEGLTFYVSRSAPIEGYDVHTCVGIPSEAVEAVSGFNNPKKDDHHGRFIEESFLQATINTCLHRADMALYLPDPGEGLEVLGDRTDIIRVSAERFVQGIAFALTPWHSDIFRYANEVSSMTYERTGAKGQLVVSRQDNLTNKLKVEFQDPVGFGETRSLRKLLELTDDSTYLLADYGSVYGLGECNAAPDVAKITIEGHARWSISVDNTTLMKVSYEHATLHRQILDRDIFRDVAERTVGAVEVNRIWDIVQCALESGHGTTIVVSEDPVNELSRLAQEALSIKPEYLDHQDVVRLGRVDGAIFLGPDGRCHAFGVILDGMATSSGDRARGARFNSSVRYQQTSEIGTMVVVISDDGTVDLIPTLMPRVWRRTVEDAVQAFCEYSGIEDNDGEEWARRNEQVNLLQFYLNEEQCAKVNESFEREMDSRLESGGFKMIRDPLQPNPSMNETYFWDS